MSLKKHPKADLEKKRSLLLLIGFALALVFTLVAFEWKSFDASNYKLGDYQVEEVEEEIIPITRMTEPPPPPPPVKPPPPPPPPTEFEEKEDATEDDTDFDSEDDEDTEQEDYEEEETNTAPAVFVVVEQMPAFRGCAAKSNNELRTCNYIETSKYFNKNQSYPYLERENGIDGTVYVSFVIGESGKPIDIKVLKSVSPGLDKEAVRLIKAMPKWTPGKQRGKAVRVSQTLPMKFTLD